MSEHQKRICEGAGACSRLMLVCCAVLTLGACTNYSNTLSPDLARLQEAIAPRDLNVFQRRDPMSGLNTPAEELIGPDGRCVSDAAPTAALNFAAERPTVVAQAEPISPEAQTAPVPAAPRGIALNMTECDVVRVAGITDKVEISTNERSQRAVVLTYMSGPRPGIYRFVAGRLVSIERGPEPPPPPKPQRPAKRQKQA